MVGDSPIYINNTDLWTPRVKNVLFLSLSVVRNIYSASIWFENIMFQESLQLKIFLLSCSHVGFIETSLFKVNMKSFMKFCLLHENIKEIGQSRYWTPSLSKIKFNYTGNNNWERDCNVLTYIISQISW